jgi:two-component system chemotaxis response regulator CheY
MKTSRAPIVLMVEDNADMRSLIRSILAETTQLIHEVENGTSAVEAYPRIQPDCVLMDIELAGMDGIAATRALREIDAQACIIMVTGHGEEPYRRAAAAAGAAAFVLKEDLLDLPTLVTDVARTSESPPEP